MEQTFMKEKNILYLVLTMSLPMVISMMVNSLYNIIDSFFVAKISEQAMTALSLVYPLQNLINAVTIGFGIGLNAVVAYFLGAQDQTQYAAWTCAEHRLYRCDSGFPWIFYYRSRDHRSGHTLLPDCIFICSGDLFRSFF